MSTLLRSTFSLLRPLIVFFVFRRKVALCLSGRMAHTYAGLVSSNIVQPVVFVTLGGMGTDTLRFITSLIKKKVTQATDELRATVFLRQRLGIAIQRGTAACLRETLQCDPEDPIGTDLDDD